jgi:hypothetical protein
MILDIGITRINVGKPLNNFKNKRIFKYEGRIATQASRKISKNS